MSSLTADAEDKLVPRVHHHHHINWHHHVSDSEKSGKRKKEKNRRFHGSIGLVVPADIVETNGTGRAKRRKMQQKKKQEQDDKGKVKGTTCCLWLKQLQTKSQALEDKEEDKTAKANPIRGNGLKSSGG